MVVSFLFRWPSADTDFLDDFLFRFGRIGFAVAKLPDLADKVT